MSKNAEQDDKKTLILNSAEYIFQSKDYHQATVEEIAKKAGVGKGTIYQYFSSKQDILQELYQKGKDEYIKRVNELMETAETIAEVIGEIISFHIDNVSCSRIMLRSVMHSGDINHSQFESSKHEIEHIMEIMWQKGVKSGEIKDISQEVFASYLIGIMMSAMVHMVMHKPQLIDTEKVKAEFKQLAIRGLCAK